MNDLVRKVGYVSTIVGVLSTAVVIDAVPLELWQQAAEAIHDTELHDALNATTYDRAEGWDLRGVFPVPYRPDFVVVILNGDRIAPADSTNMERERDWLLVHRSAWGHLTREEASQ